jgi:hypothetical protein
LTHDAESLLPTGKVDVSEVDTIDENPATRWVVETHEEIGDGAFASAAGADQGDRLTATNVELDGGEGFGQIRAIAKCDIIQLYAFMEGREWRAS